MSDPEQEKNEQDSNMGAALIATTAMGAMLIIFAACVGLAWSAFTYMRGYCG